MKLTPQEIAQLAEDCINNHLTKDQVNFYVQKINRNPSEITDSNDLKAYYSNVIQYLLQRDELKNWLLELTAEKIVFAKEWLKKLSLLSKRKNSIELAEHRMQRVTTGGIIIADDERSAIWSAITHDVVGEGGFAVKLPRDFDSDGAAIALLNAVPSFVLLPLTLPRFGSLRIAEFAHRRGFETRVVLISGTDCNKETLELLFDSAIRPGELTVTSLRNALRKPVHRKEEEKDIEAAIDSILKTASCFLIYARQHIFPHHPSIYDYHGNQKEIITTGDYLRIIKEIRQLRTAFEMAAVTDMVLLNALRTIENGTMWELRMKEGPCVKPEATPDQIRVIAKEALETAEKMGLDISAATLKDWLGS